MAVLGSFLEGEKSSWSSLQRTERWNFNVTHVTDYFLVNLSNITCYSAKQGNCMRCNIRENGWNSKTTPIRHDNDKLAAYTVYTQNHSRSSTRIAHAAIYTYHILICVVGVLLTFPKHWNSRNWGLWNLVTTTVCELTSRWRCCPKVGKLSFSLHQWNVKHKEENHGWCLSVVNKWRND